jgi:hypothetical protein
MLLLFLGHLLMQFELLEVAVRLWILATASSTLASAALIAIVACRQKLGINLGLRFDVEPGYECDAVKLVFAIAEFSLIGSAIILGLVKHFFFR